MWRLRPDRFIAGLIVVFVCLHVALLVFLPDPADKLLLGDRSHMRLWDIERLLAAEGMDGTLARIFRRSAPGDHLLFAPAYALWGAHGVVLQGVLLYAVGVFFLYRIGLLLSARTARVASVTWCLLPSTLFHPHVLVTEAIVNPGLIVATFFLLRLLASKDDRWGDALLLGAALGLIGFVRYGALLLPVLAAARVLFTAQGWARAVRWRQALLVLGLGVAPALLFLLASTALKDRYPSREVMGSLGSNFYLRAERMARLGGLSLGAEIEERRKVHEDELGTLTTREFAALVAERPTSYLRTVPHDLFNLFANPGATKLFGHFLALYDLGDRTALDTERWREVRESQGLWALLHRLWDRSPIGFLITAATGAAWFVFLAGAVIGAVRLLRDPSRLPGLAAVLMGVAAYHVLVNALVAGYTRWDHRSSFEFVLALLFALAVTAVRTGKR